MKKCLDVLLNKLYKDKLEEFFGIGSHVIVNYVKYSTNAHTFVIDCKLNITNHELIEEFWPLALDIIIEESWKYVAIDAPITIVRSFDII